MLWCLPEPNLSREYRWCGRQAMQSNNSSNKKLVIRLVASQVEISSTHDIFFFQINVIRNSQHFNRILYATINDDSCFAWSRNFFHDWLEIVAVFWQSINIDLRIQLKHIMKSSQTIKAIVNNYKTSPSVVGDNITNGSCKFIRVRKQISCELTIWITAGFGRLPQCNEMGNVQIIANGSNGLCKKKREYFILKTQRKCAFYQMNMENSVQIWLLLQSRLVHMLWTKQKKSIKHQIAELISSHFTGQFRFKWVHSVDFFDMRHEFKISTVSILSVNGNFKCFEAVRYVRIENATCANQENEWEQVQSVLFTQQIHHTQRRHWFIYIFRFSEVTRTIECSKRNQRDFFFCSCLLFHDHQLKISTFFFSSTFSSTLYSLMLFLNWKIQLNSLPIGIICCATHKCNKNNKPKRIETIFI